ncbi:hypothetical protein EHQ90_07810, partial [Leptospira stimsonii]
METTLSIIENAENPIVSLVEKFVDLEPETRQSLTKSFVEFLSQADEWESRKTELLVTDASQTKEMKAAKEARLTLKKIRVNAEHTRKRLKQDSLQKGKAIDSIAKIINEKIEPLETYYEAQEKFVEIEEAKRIQKLRDERIPKLAPYVENVAYFDLVNMTESAFQDLVLSSKSASEAKAEKEKKDNEERIAKEQEAESERAKIKAENEVLANENKALSTELEMKKQQEEKVKKEEQHRSMVASLLPDKEKLLELVRTLDSIQLPELKTEEAKAILENV